jgi:hypothetical protein
VSICFIRNKTEDCPSGVALSRKGPALIPLSASSGRLTDETNELLGHALLAGATGKTPISVVAAMDATWLVLFIIAYVRTAKVGERPWLWSP